MFLQIVSDPNPRGTVAQMRAGRLLTRDEVHSRLTWQGWNIVEGPGGEFRSDDPDDNYDGWSTIKGVSANQRKRLQSVNSLYSVMSRLARNTKKTDGSFETPIISVSEARALEIVFLAEMSLRGGRPISYTENMWEVVRAGKVMKHFPNRWEVEPIWKKAS
ncbi:hypothetical protein ACFSGX_11995 [Sphingomonas arantia]|uniref:Uncharacterized protein n=1 Tax=Sphingomonas arantia TaxID=1460676 RepID=A0ABW4TZR4_9SPHN